MGVDTNTDKKEIPQEWVYASIATATFLALLFPQSRRTLAHVVGGFIKQIVLLASMMCVLIVWWRYNELNDSTTFSGPQSIILFSTAKFLISTGTAIFVLGLVYQLLPIDIIPDFVPFFGRLDDILAGMVMGIGMLSSRTLLLLQFVQRIM
jgi:hypothetical protein